MDLALHHRRLHPEEYHRDTVLKVVRAGGHQRSVLVDRQHVNIKIGDMTSFL